MWAFHEPGGGAIELEISKHLRNYAKQIQGKQQLVISAFAKSLEIIPRTIANNAGLDSLKIIARLRKEHSLENGQGKFFGVDINPENPDGICNTAEKYIWEPILVKQNALSSACEVTS